MRARGRLPVLAAVVTAVALAGCAPSGLDAQQQQAESRECASLLVRHVARRVPIGALVVQGRVIDLGRDPAGFFAALAELRGVDAFPLTGGKADTTTRASFVSDLCRPKDASSSKPATTTTTTTTSPTTTTAPPGDGG